MIYHYSTGKKTTTRNHNSKRKTKVVFFGWVLKERRKEAKRTRTMKVTDDFFAIPCKDSKRIPGESKIENTGFYQCTSALKTGNFRRSKRHKRKPFHLY